jgi:hypothetical protein
MNSSTSISRLKFLLLYVLGALSPLLVMFAAVEGTLRLLPVIGGVHRADPQSPNASARSVAHRDYTSSLGWDMRHVVYGRTNGMGFLSPHEYTADRRAVALLGDSFVEAQMLGHDESLAGQLEARWGGRVYAYNFGVSGASLSHYLGMARELGSQFTFDAAVVVITRGDYAEGFERQEGLYSWGESTGVGEDLVKLVPAVPRSGLRQLARELATVRYVRGNMKLTLDNILPAERKGCTPQSLSGQDKARLSQYVEALPEALRLPPGKVVLVFNAPASEVYDLVDRNRAAKARCLDLDANAIAYLRERARARGLKIVDAARVFENHYRAHRRQLDFSPVDGHWNGTGSGAIAAEVDATLAGRRMIARRGSMERVAQR